MHVSVTTCPAETGLGLALTDAVRAPGVIVVVLSKESDVVASAFIISRRKRRGEAKTASRPKIQLYVTVTVKDGPVPAGVKLPAQTLMVTGEVVVPCAASDVGTPMGVCQTRLLLDDGQPPAVIPVPENVTFGISGAVPWLSMQKYAEVGATAPEVNAHCNDAKPEFWYLTSASAGHEVKAVKVGCVMKMFWPATIVEVLLNVTWTKAKPTLTISIGITNASSFNHRVFIVRC